MKRPDEILNILQGKQKELYVEDFEGNVYLKQLSMLEKL